MLKRTTVMLLDDSGNGADWRFFEEEIEHLTHHDCLDIIHNKMPVDIIVAIWTITATVPQS